MSANLKGPAVATGLERSILIPIPKKGSTKECAKGKGKGKLLCCVRLFATPWTVAYQAPPSMGFSRQEYWSRLPFHYWTIAHISHASKVMLNILNIKLRHYASQELPDGQAQFIKGRGTRDQIANIHWIIEKVRGLQKNIYLCFIDYAKAFDCVDHNKLWKALKEMGISDRLPVS